MHKYFHGEFWGGVLIHLITCDLWINPSHLNDKVCIFSHVKYPLYSIMDIILWLVFQHILVLNEELLLEKI